MASIQSPVKRFVKRLLSAVFVLLAVNILLLGFYAHYYKKSVSEQMLPIPLLKLVSASLIFDGHRFILKQSTVEQLNSQHVWAMLLDDRKGTVIWQHHLPRELPQKYTLSDIALLSRYYLKDYPTYTWKHPQGLIILGFPKNSMAKITGMLPQTEVSEMEWKITGIIICDLLILLLIYFIIDRRALKSVVDILNGIKALATGKVIHLDEKGSLSEIAAQLNKASRLLETRSTAQEKWIAGVSHDVRTPLSVILGYSEQIEQNISVPKDVQEKASNIKLQGIRLRNLINDLNLATRLGNENILTEQVRFHPAGFSRNLLADFLNDMSNDNFPVEIDINKDSESGYITGDLHLLRRAFDNVLNNSIRHNPNGCNIFFKVHKAENNFIFTLSDNGKGLTPEEFESLQNRVHYHLYTHPVLSQQHGLGLYIVRQIIRLHNGTVSFGSSESGGFQTSITLKAQ